MDHRSELYNNPDILKQLQSITMNSIQLEPIPLVKLDRLNALIKLSVIMSAPSFSVPISTSSFGYMHFYNHVRITNVMAMNGQNSSRIFQATGKKENVSGF